MHLTSLDSYLSSDNTYRSPQRRKEILRHVYINAQALQRNVNTKTIEDLEHIINEVDTINEEGNVKDKVKDQSEVLLDSEIMTISSNVLKKCSFSLSKNISSYSHTELANKIKSYLRTVPDTILNDDHDWSLLGNDVLQYFKKTSNFLMILGVLQMIPRKQIVRRKPVREAQALTKRPDNVIVVEKMEDSVEQTVIEIKKIIVQHQKHNKIPLDFFALVLHPTDFGKTIENMLHVSFLVRDGIIYFTTDKNGIPKVQNTNKDILTDVREKKKKRNIQNILSLNMNQWKALVEAYKIKTPMIDLSIINARNKS